MATPFWGPEKAWPAVKNSVALVLLRLARMTMNSVMTTNAAKMLMLTAGLPTLSAARS